MYGLEVVQVRHWAVKFYGGEKLHSDDCEDVDYEDHQKAHIHERKHRRADCLVDNLLLLQAFRRSYDFEEHDAPQQGQNQSLLLLAWRNENQRPDDYCEFKFVPAASEVVFAISYDF